MFLGILGYRMGPYLEAVIVSGHYKDPTNYDCGF